MTISVTVLLSKAEEKVPLCTLNSQGFVLECTMVYTCTFSSALSACCLHVHCPLSESVCIRASISYPDILLNLPVEYQDLQNRISLLCEEVWYRGVEEKENMVPNCLLYLVARTLAHGAKVS